jgi:aminopeptidase YwaD
VKSENPFIHLDEKIIGDVYTNSEVMENLLVLCDEYGSRFGGTEGERKAAEFFQQKMKAYGLQNVHQEPVPYVGWRRGDAKLEILSPISKKIDCISLPLSPAGTVESTIIDMEDGAPSEFEARSAEIKDKVVMTTSVVAPAGSKRWIHRGEKYGRSVLAGARAFIFVNHYAGYGPATGGVGHDGPGHIPAISICKEDGAFLQRLIQRHGEVKVRITTTDHSEPMTSWNVLGDLPGQEDPDLIVMIGCHYDGHDISQGAEDPASGVVAILEAARVLAKYAPQLPYTIRFAMWGVEEIGLLGSREYVKAHKDELANIRFYLNMDSAGSSRNNRDVIVNEWEQLEPLFKGYSQEMALDFKVAQSLSAFSDHFPFFLEGVPTGGMESAERSLGGRGYGHTRYDTVDKVEIRSLREAAVLAARLSLRMASEKRWPAAKREPAVVQKLLDRPDYQEEKAFRESLDAFYAQEEKDKPV